jgi:hypothetical protein
MKFGSDGARPAILTSGGAAGVNGQFIASAMPAASLSFPQPFTRSSVIGFPAGLAPANGNPIVMNSGVDTYIVLYTTASDSLSMYAYDARPASSGSGFTAVTGLTAGSTGVALETFNRAASSCVFNGMLRTGALGGGSTSMLGLGSNVNGSARSANATYCEVIVFPQVLSTGDQTALMNDQNWYWSTP